jgi:hypothetical protein
MGIISTYLLYYIYRVEEGIFLACMCLLSHFYYVPFLRTLFLRDKKQSRSPQKPYSLNPVKKTGETSTCQLSYFNFVYIGTSPSIYIINDLFLHL